MYQFHASYSALEVLLLDICTMLLFDQQVIKFFCLGRHIPMRGQPRAVETHARTIALVRRGEDFGDLVNVQPPRSRHR